MSDVPVISGADEVRDIWVDYHLDPLPRPEGVALVPTFQAEFDRWLEDERAQVREQVAQALSRWAADLDAMSLAHEIPSEASILRTRRDATKLAVRIARTGALAQQ